MESKTNNLGRSADVDDQTPQSALQTSQDEGKETTAGNGAVSTPRQRSSSIPRRSVVEGLPDGIEIHARVLVLYTGGTIGMKASSEGYVPAKNFMQNYLFTLPQAHDQILPKTDLVMPVSRFNKRIMYKIIEYDPLLDSCNIGHSDWIRIAQDVEKNYDEYQGFVILHGTDTMAYTASGLSFIFRNLGKTVILTGSQIPLSQPGNDGLDNFLGALTIAGHFQIPEVCVYFHNKLLRGCRCTKRSASELDAFDSPNSPPLATVGIGIEVKWNLIYHNDADNEPFKVFPRLSANVAVLRLFPGITSKIIQNFIRPPLEELRGNTTGLVLMSYGAGNAPDKNERFLEVMATTSERGIVVVNISQCFQGKADTAYATGKALANRGVLCGFDMTVEAAVAKLSYLLARYDDIDEVKRQMVVSLRGELTESQDASRFSFKDKKFIHAVAKSLGTADKKVEQAIMPTLFCAATASGDMTDLARLCDYAPRYVSEPDYDGRTALHIAATHGNLAALQLLLSRGAGAHVNLCDTHGFSPLDYALRGNHEGCVEILRRSGAASYSSSSPSSIAVSRKRARSGNLSTQT